MKTKRQIPPTQLNIALNVQLSIKFLTRNSSGAMPAEPIPGKRGEPSVGLNLPPSPAQFRFDPIK